MKSSPLATSSPAHPPLDARPTIPGPADADVWERAASGDEEATERLMQRVRVEARAWLGRLGLPEAEREDLVAEVQVAVLRLLRAGTPAPRNLGGFLYFRSRAVTSRYLRRKAVRSTTEELLRPDDRGADAPGPDRLASRAELLEASRVCRQELPEPLSEVLRLRYEEGLSQSSVGRRLDKSDVWVHRRVRQALSLLSHCLRKKGWTQ